MKIALIGYGKMGKEIEAIAKSRGHVIGLILVENNINTSALNDLKNVDVVIEFSAPHAAVDNIQKCFAAHVPVVVGTTGWYTHLDFVKTEMKNFDGGLFYSSNFSVGVNLFFRLNEYLAGMMEKQTEYNVEIEEYHHIHKKDAPSGTGITLAEGILKHINRKTNYTIDEVKSEEDLFIKVYREGEIPGTHTVKYTSAVDDIEIKHTAHNRKGFALGAVLAAEFMVGKKGAYGMKDLLGF